MESFMKKILCLLFFFLMISGYNKATPSTSDDIDMFASALCELGKITWASKGIFAGIAKHDYLKKLDNRIQNSLRTAVAQEFLNEKIENFVNKLNSYSLKKYEETILKNAKNLKKYLDECITKKHVKKIDIPSQRKEKIKELLTWKIDIIEKFPEDYFGTINKQIEECSNQVQYIFAKLTELEQKWLESKPGEQQQTCKKIRKAEKELNEQESIQDLWETLDLVNKNFKKITNISDEISKKEFEKLLLKYATSNAINEKKQGIFLNKLKQKSTTLKKLIEEQIPEIKNIRKEFIKELYVAEELTKLINTPLIKGKENAYKQTVEKLIRKIINKINSSRKLSNFIKNEWETYLKNLQEKLIKFKFEEKKISEEYKIKVDELIDKASRAGKTVEKYILDLSEIEAENWEKIYNIGIELNKPNFTNEILTRIILKLGLKKRKKPMEKFQNNG